MAGDSIIQIITGIPPVKSGNQGCQQKTDAIKNNEQFYFTGKPCKRGHIAKRFTSNSVFGSFSIAMKILSKNSGLTWTGRIPMFKELFLKISAKELETTQRKP